MVRNFEAVELGPAAVDAPAGEEDGAATLGAEREGDQAEGRHQEQEAEGGGRRRMRHAPTLPSVARG
jgi:hypothetical protein